MSLKAKLEAVVYAAEEPVTLAQLAALFAADALEWKAAQEAASAEAAVEQATPASEPLPLLNAAFEYVDLDSDQSAAAPSEPAEAQLEQVPDGPVDAHGEPAEEAAGSRKAENDVEGASTETDFEGAGEIAGEAVVEKAAAAQADPEAEAKRLARLRDREVRTILRGLLDELISTYASDDRGIEIKEIAGGYRMATKPECHDAARMFVKSLKPALKLSLPALETLAVVAYKQPVTAPEVNEIRGVDSSGVFGSLLARKLIATAGRKQVIGRPILYKTTKEFLLRFGLNDVSELPSMEEFEKMAELEFDEAETGGEGDSVSGGIEDLSLEVDDYRNEPVEEPTANAALETQETTGVTGTAAMQAEPIHAQAAPAAPSPLPEQAETETVPHDR